MWVVSLLTVSPISIAGSWTTQQRIFEPPSMQPLLDCDDAVGGTEKRRDRLTAARREQRGRIRLAMSRSVGRPIETASSNGMLTKVPISHNVWSSWIRERALLSSPVAPSPASNRAVEIAGEFRLCGCKDRPFPRSVVRSHQSHCKAGGQSVTLS